MKSVVNEEHIMGNAEIRGIHCTVEVIEAAGIYHRAGETDG